MNVDFARLHQALRAARAAGDRAKVDELENMLAMARENPADFLKDYPMYVYQASNAAYPRGRWTEANRDRWKAKIDQLLEDTGDCSFAEADGLEVKVDQLVAKLVGATEVDAVMSGFSSRRPLNEALRTVNVEPDGFGGLNADEATPEQLASVFSKDFGPFDEVSDLTAEAPLAGYERYLRVTGSKGQFTITADVVRDSEQVVDNELEIFKA